LFLGIGFVHNDNDPIGLFSSSLLVSLLCLVRLVLSIIVWCRVVPTNMSTNGFFVPFSRTLTVGKIMPNDSGEAECQG
jgi:hypothetical protein